MYIVSSCLLGYPCRYDARSCPFEFLTGKDIREFLIPVCPEVLGGLGIPRCPAEVRGGDGDDVLAGTARVLDSSGRDVTEEYLKGAWISLGIALQSGAKAAILKARSPSCGPGSIYDGTFSRTLRPGDGVFAALLRRHGIEVYSEETAREVLEQLPRLSRS